MKGIRPHSHADRERVVRELVPKLQRKFGDNLVAIAAQASFARGDDTDYSDLELMVFLREMPDSRKSAGITRIRDGLLIDIWVTTGHEYINRIKKVTREWHAAGADVLVPIINEPFVNELKAYALPDLRERCRDRAVRFWPAVQESAAKVLNGVAAANRDGLPLLLFYFQSDTLACLSFLNQRPYTTLARFAAEARTLSLKPPRYDEFLDFMAAGAYTDLEKTRGLVVAVIEGLEEIFEGEGLELYPENPIENLELNPPD